MFFRTKLKKNSKTNVVSQVTSIVSQVTSLVLQFTIHKSQV